jgi:hypothetical protein
MNILECILTYIGVMAIIFGSGYLLTNVIEFFYDLRRSIRDCRDALRRLEEKR